MIYTGLLDPLGDDVQPVKIVEPGGAGEMVPVSMKFPPDINLRPIVATKIADGPNDIDIIWVRIDD